MCPFFKKGDKSRISNYRPITLLNCDYKLLTKTYSVRLMNVAPSLVHPNQAGFMKGRKIEDQVKLAKFLLDYAEAAEEDGVIVYLDQEKAYDRINHTYLGCRPWQGPAGYDNHFLYYLFRTANLVPYGLEMK
jgi:hypothetical protein